MLCPAQAVHRGAHAKPSTQQELLGKQQSARRGCLACQNLTISRVTNSEMGTR